MSEDSTRRQRRAALLQARRAHDAGPRRQTTLGSPSPGAGEGETSGPVLAAYAALREFLSHKSPEPRDVRYDRFAKAFNDLLHCQAPAAEPAFLYLTAEMEGASTVVANWVSMFIEDPEFRDDPQGCHGCAVLLELGAIPGAYGPALTPVYLPEQLSAELDAFLNEVDDAAVWGGDHADASISISPIALLVHPGEPELGKLLPAIKTQRAIARWRAEKRDDVDEIDVDPKLVACLPGNRYFALGWMRINGVALAEAASFFDDLRFPDTAPSVTLQVGRDQHEVPILGLYLARHLFALFYDAQVQAAWELIEQDAGDADSATLVVCPSKFPQVFNVRLQLSGAQSGAEHTTDLGLVQYPAYLLAALRSALAPVCEVDYRVDYQDDDDEDNAGDDESD